MKQKKIIVWRTKMVQKVNKSWKRMFSISVDQEREKDEVKPKRRMPENSSSEVYVFFNWNNAANMRMSWHLRGLYSMRICMVCIFILSFFAPNLYSSLGSNRDVMAPDRHSPWNGALVKVSRRKTRRCTCSSFWQKTFLSFKKCVNRVRFGCL